MNVNGKKLTSLWTENKSVKIIDQTKLPFLVSIKQLRTKQDFINAINKMEVRGAPLIGVTAAYGFAISIKNNATKKNIDKVYADFFKTRPTAVNLKWAIDEVRSSIMDVDCNKRFLSILLDLQNPFVQHLHEQILFLMKPSFSIKV